MLVLSANQAAPRPMSAEESEISSAKTEPDEPKPDELGNQIPDEQMRGVKAEIESVSGWMSLGETPEYSTDPPRVRL